MARQKKFPEPKDDIPAWFMTYSDVITLLMTFFILLLTFATTEPERFEKSLSTTFSKGSATGTAGKKMTEMDKDSFINRLRPPAARIAMRGAEMPPITRGDARKALGAGLRSLNADEKKQNELTPHTFDVPVVHVFNSDGELTKDGKLLCQMLSTQLQDLPFHASIQFSEYKHAKKLADMMEYLFHTEKTRPGQVSMSLLRQSQLSNDNIRIEIKRFSQNEAQQSQAHLDVYEAESANAKLGR